MHYCGENHRYRRNHGSTQIGVADRIALRLKECEKQALKNVDFKTDFSKESGDRIANRHISQHNQHKNREAQSTYCLKKKDADLRYIQS